MSIFITRNILRIRLNLRPENSRNFFIFSDPSDRCNIRSDPEEQRMRPWQPSQRLSFYSEKHAVYRDFSRIIRLEVVVRADLEQLGRYFKSVVETLDWRRDFKVGEEAIHGFCDAGLILRDVSCVDMV